MSLTVCLHSRETMQNASPSDNAALSSQEIADIDVSDFNKAQEDSN